MQNTDDALLARWYDNGDAAAFRELTIRYAGLVYATAKRILRDAIEAEDVAQECFETLALRQRDVPQHLGAWLHRVATNRALKTLTSAQRRQARELRAAESQPELTRTEWDDIYEHVDAAIAELPEEFREAVVGHYLQGQSKVALAEALGVSRPTVHYRIDKGLEQVRRTLKERGVTASAAAFTTALAATGTEALPTSLTAALGKIAVSGASVAGGQAAAPVLMAGALTAKNLLALAAVAIVVIGGVGLALRLQPPPSTPTVGVADDAANADADASDPPADSSEVVSEVATAPSIASDAAPPGAEVVDAGLGDLAIAGRVVDVHEAPIAGALLRFQLASLEELSWGSTTVGVAPSGLVEATSGPNGEFRISGFGEATYSGHVTCDGYSNGILRLAAGTEDAVVVMENASTIRVRVTSAASGEPITDFEVALHRGKTKRSTSPFYDAWKPVTASDGPYEIQSVSLGEYGVFARASGYVMAMAPVTVEKGGSVQTVDLALEPGRLVEGRVTDERGAPVLGAWIFTEAPVDPAQLARLAPEAVAAHGDRMARDSIVTADGTGFFRIDTLTGEERALYALHPEKGGGLVELRWQGADALHNADISLERASGVLDVLVTEGGAPLEGATVAANGFVPSGNSYAQQTTGPDGAVMLEAIPSGPLHIRVEHPGTRRQPRVKTAPAEVFSSTATELRIDFPKPSVQLAGQITTGLDMPIQGIAMLHVSDSDGVEMYQRSIDESGHFSFEEIIPGEAELRITVRYGDIRAERKETVELTEDDEHWVEFDLGAEGSVVGTLAGFPKNHFGDILVARGTVVLSGSGEEKINAASRDVAGAGSAGNVGMYEVAGVAHRKYKIEAIPPGKYTVIAVVYPEGSGDLNAYRFYSQAVEVVAGEEATADFDLRE